MSQSTTEEIKSRLDIVDVIREYVELKPAGTNLKAKCPFHNEKTPSFMVSRERQMYHCFGCGEHGDVFSFVEKMEGIDFPEALRILAKRAGVTIQTEDPQLRTERTKQHDIMRYAVRVYQEHLRRLPKTHPVRLYIEKRELTDELIDLYQIGFAPDAWDELTTLFTKKNVRLADGQAAGLLVRKDDGSGYYDRFRARLMFPIHDVHGNAVGFGGRVLPELAARAAGKEAAKYINTPQSIIYNKSAVLYGLHLAKQAIREQKCIIVVEGYMDCLAAHKAGTQNVVAASGTAFTADQAKLIKRFTDNVILAFDMDAAGVQATARGVNVLLQEGLTVRIVSLPEGKDPDELIRTKPGAWLQALADPKLFLDFAFEQTMKGKDPARVEHKKTISKELLPIIAGLADPIEQSHYLQKLGELLHVEESVLRNAIAKQKIPDGRHRTAAVSPAGQKKIDSRSLAAQELMSVFISKPDFFETAYNDMPEEAYPQGPWRILYRELRYQYNKEHGINFAKLRQILPTLDSGVDALQSLNISELGASRHTDAVERTGQKLINILMKEYLRSRLTAISADMASAEKEKNKEKLEHLAQSFATVSNQLKKFTSQM